MEAVGRQLVGGHVVPELVRGHTLRGQLSMHAVEPLSGSADLLVVLLLKMRTMVVDPRSGSA